MEFFIIRNGEQTGPFSPDTVHALLNTGSLKTDDMAWRKGLSAWMPLNEALDPDATERDEPPPLDGIAAPRRKATAKQKALLNFLGAKFGDDISKDEAAVVISDALENPKQANRFAKWNEEKLRLHADIFQDEIDHRRANRVARYLELCQTDGAEAVKDVTKAHVQVLIESLDKRTPTWEQEPRRALWDFLLPSIAEHFPQLIRDEWKGKMQFGGAPKIAAAVVGAHTAGTLAPPTPPGAIQAAMRGVIYGTLVLGIVLGGLFMWENRNKNPGTPAPASAAKPADAPKKPDTEPPAPAHPTEAPPIAFNPPAETPPADAPPKDAPPAPTPAEKPPTPAVAANTPPMIEPAPAAPPAPAPAPATPPANPAATFTPAPPPPPLNTPPAAPVPAPAPAAAPPREFTTLTKAVAVQLQFGRVTLPVGARAKLIAIEGQNARVNFNNNVILVPLAATDIEPGTVPATALTNPPPATLTPAPATPPAAPTNPPKPSSDL